MKVGIGFATGRKSFQRVLRTYVYNFMESGLVENDEISLSLLVAYDLTYQKTKATDYTRIPPDIAGQIDSAKFIGTPCIKEKINDLINEGVLNPQEALMIFGKGYAARRNAVLYYAVKQNIDYLIFLDDDEYPVAVTNTRGSAVWGGQHVVATHLKHIVRADITHGRHCGYISPIPFVEFNDTMKEADFRLFIEAISNDIVNWDAIRTIMKNGGVTYADTKILTSDDVAEVREVNNSKFISGGNLGINLTNPRRVLPFYNPPGARGEDTFLSTCLSERKVLKVPCYTFHDGFSTYNHLLAGVLPTKLKFIKADSEQIVNRFYRTCIGWIRYKPLLLYITQPDCYEENIKNINKQLNEVLPRICTYFNQPAFMNILTELRKYHSRVQKHNQEFLETQGIWAKIMDHFA